jgi:YaiO family outer membrane protein
MTLLQRILVLLVPALAGFAGDVRAQSAETFSEIGFRMNRETLTGGRLGWRDDTVELAHQFERRKLLLGRLTQTERFGLSDSTAAIAGYFPFGDQTTVYVEQTLSSTHRVLPRGSTHVQLSRAMAGGWGLIGGWKHVRYDSTDVDVADLGVERYFSNYRAAFTVLPSRSETAGSALSYRLQLGYYYGERNNFQLVMGDGTEVDKPTGAGLIVSTPVRSIGLYGRHWLSSLWAFEYGAGQSVQGGYTRRSLDAGLRFRF